MRNPIATPASIIIVILILSFGFFLFMSYITNSGTAVISPYLAEYIWGSAFIGFFAHFAAIQCAGAMIAYSLFLSPPLFSNPASALKSFSSIILSILVLTALFAICQETIVPAINKNIDEKIALSTFSNVFFEKAREKEKEGDPVTAAEYLRLSLTIDKHNPEKISENSSLISTLSAEEFKEYNLRTSTDDRLESVDSAVLITRAQKALDNKNYIDAYYFAQQILTTNDTNKEALRISSIAQEKDFAGIKAREKARAQDLFAKKQEGYNALTDTSNPDYIKAYFIFIELTNQYPFDKSVREYLDQTRQLLPTMSFFTYEAEIIVSIEALDKGPIVFFNRHINDYPDNKENTAESEPKINEIISISSMVQVRDGIFFKDIEVIGFLPNNSILYHYYAPIGKRAGNTIILNGIHRTNSKARTALTIYKGTPLIDPLYGIQLFPLLDENAQPGTLDIFSFTKKDFNKMNLLDLFFLLPLVSRHAQMTELIHVEIITHICTPIIILVLSLLCLVIGMKHTIAQDASTIRHLYILLPLIPFVMASIVGFLLFLHRIIISYSYYALGMVFGLVVITAGHIILLIFSLIYFSRKFLLKKKSVF